MLKALQFEATLLDLVVRLRGCGDRTLLALDFLGPFAEVHLLNESDQLLPGEELSLFLPCSQSDLSTRAEGVNVSAQKRLCSVQAHE